MPSSCTLAARAKVNLHLSVGARREDGYHDVTTILTALELADSLTLEEAGELAVNCLPEVTGRPEDNLVHRAAVAMGLAFGREPSVSIHIEKRIPHGAGLGGGSSDAAATIRAISTLWDIPAEDPRPYAIAAALGADVPFFLTGGTLLMGGRGDEPVRQLRSPRLDIALVKPEAAVPTAAAYAAFDARPSHPRDPGPIMDALSSGEPTAIAELLFNNLEDAACGLVAGVRETLAWVRARDGVLGAHVSGSGSAVFAICGDGDCARRIADDAAAHGWWSAATTTAPDAEPSCSDGEAMA